MALRLGILLFGTLLVYCGWTNRAVIPTLLGNNTVTKKPVTKTAAGIVG